MLQLFSLLSLAPCYMFQTLGKRQKVNKKNNLDAEIFQFLESKFFMGIVAPGLLGQFSISTENTVEPHLITTPEKQPTAL